ncbi:MAG: NlpC/P60 family protein [Armatimonadota bacterium]
MFASFSYGDTLTLSLESPGLSSQTGHFVSSGEASNTKKDPSRSGEDYIKLGKVGIVVASKANIYQARSPKSAVYYTVRQETPLAIVKEEGPWYGVLMSNGAIGWISKHLVRLTDYAVVVDKELRSRFQVASRGYTNRNRFLGERIVQTAFRYLGVPYVFGGTDPATGMDCSAFVRMVFAHHGIGLPRTAREQAQIGASVPFDQLQPGDRLYFQCKNSYIDHCGIYAGNGYFIHCSASRNGVAVDSLASDFYWRSLAVARR